MDEERKGAVVGRGEGEKEDERRSGTILITFKLVWRGYGSFKIPFPISIFLYQVLKLSFNTP